MKLLTHTKNLYRFFPTANSPWKAMWLTLTDFDWYLISNVCICFNMYIIFNVHVCDKSIISCIGIMNIGNKSIDHPHCSYICSKDTQHLCLENSVCRNSLTRLLIGICDFSLKDSLHNHIYISSNIRKCRCSTHESLPKSPDISGSNYTFGKKLG